MTTIGGAWIKGKEKDGKQTYYYSCSFDEAILPLTLDSNKRLILKENKNKGDNEKAPDMLIDIFIPKEKKEEKISDPNFKENTITDDEVPFM